MRSRALKRTAAPEDGLFALWLSTSGSGFTRLCNVYPNMSAFKVGG